MFGHSISLTVFDRIDSFIYVWHKQNGQLVERLQGHTGTVNCVTWNPSNPQMFASAGDDRTIRMYDARP
jgi:WD40 repeat protein